MKFNKRDLIKFGIAALAVSTLVVAGSAFAANPTPPATPMTFSQLQTNIQGTAGGIWKIVQIVITLAGLLLIVKGLVHLKQNYTGTGQEKHLSKGLASLIFGSLLFIVVPITHVLVGSVAGSDGQAYNSFDTGTDYAQSIS
ncbi:MAG: hypothetical protein Q7V63_03590 [Gammaproteobacteria bacterium]|nr:hypothetical protein [Gammaproteobacteria bacterium]